MAWGYFKGVMEDCREPLTNDDEWALDEEQRFTLMELFQMLGMDYGCY